MGLRGPKKRSQEEVIEANKLVRSHHKIDDYLPTTEIAATLPKKPRFLSPLAIEVWEETLPDLIQMGIHSVDSKLFGMYCQNVADHEKHTIYCQKNGDTYSDDVGHFYARPEIKMAAEAEKRATALAEKFGLTIKARQAMSIVLKRADTGKPSATDQKKAKFGFENKE